MWPMIAATVGTTLLQGLASRSAGNAQRDAANAATAEQRRQFDLMREDQQPWMQAGRDALTPLSQLAMQGSNPLTAEQVMQEPGYQFGLQQGQRIMENNAAARGGLMSGSNLRALTQYGGDYATTRYNDAFNRMQSDLNNRFNRLASVAGVGQTASQQVNSARGSMANNIGNIGMGMANAYGARRINEANMLGNMVNQGISAYGQMQQQPQRASFGPALDQGFTQGWD
jgi:hypothetical protein